MRQSCFGVLNKELNKDKTTQLETAFTASIISATVY